MKNNLDQLIKSYSHRHGEQDGEIGALLYALGYEETEKILREANGRKIIIVLGEGIDEIKEIKFEEAHKRK